MTDIQSVLIIDDDEALAKGLQKLLCRHSFTVHTATNGSLGLKLLETKPVDLVITDIFMEKMEGLETIVALKQRFPELWLVAMSGGSKVVGLDCLHLAKTLGADRLLRKPIVIRTLLDLIQELNSATARPARKRFTSNTPPSNSNTSGNLV